MVVPKFGGTSVDDEDGGGSVPTSAGTDGDTEQGKARTGDEGSAIDLSARGERRQCAAPLSQTSSSANHLRLRMAVQVRAR